MPRSHLVPLLTFTLFSLFPLSPLSGDDPAPPAQLTPDERQALQAEAARRRNIADEIQKQIKKREVLEAEAARLREEVQRLPKEVKLAVELKVGEQELAANRKLLGNVHKDIAFDLAWLAERYEWLEDFATAKKYRAEVVEIQTQLVGKDHWRVIDARLALKHVDVLQKLTADSR